VLINAKIDPVISFAKASVNTPLTTRIPPIKVKVCLISPWNCCDDIIGFLYKYIEKQENKYFIQSQL
jgi:hypothetical protein